jgi:quinol monooxygenase YgiN
LSLRVDEVSLISPVENLETVRGKDLIIITIKMEIPQDKTKELLQAMLVITERMRIENGCIECDFLKDVEGENRYRLVGKWQREDDLNSHLQSEEFSVVLGAMSLLQNQAEIRLDVVSSTKGIEAIHKARDAQKRNNIRG